MSDRETALQNLSVGDIFHARSPGGASLVCLVTRVDDASIHARRIHSQDDLQFDRRTGIKLAGPPSKIDCVAPFPPDIHRVFVEMDRKHQELAALLDQGVEPELDRRRLTPDESRANRFVDEHVAANPI
ncbi:MAG TPA: hypothetical protein VFQ90_16810 [Stellaceae bacterium]|jgi:hypothetical protein|nr:hypothetical protein [Stellaceae bacterium]